VGAIIIIIIINIIVDQLHCVCCCFGCRNLSEFTYALFLAEGMRTLVFSPVPYYRPISKPTSSRRRLSQRPLRRRPLLQ
jgi:hypothetical protein